MGREMTEEFEWFTLEIPLFKPSDTNFILDLSKRRWRKGVRRRNVKISQEVRIRY